MTELVRGARKEDQRREMRDERIERRMKGEGGDMKEEGEWGREWGSEWDEGICSRDGKWRRGGKKAGGRRGRGEGKRREGGGRRDEGGGRKDEG